MEIDSYWNTHFSHFWLCGISENGVTLIVGQMEMAHRFDLSLPVLT